MIKAMFKSMVGIVLFGMLIGWVPIPGTGGKYLINNTTGFVRNDDEAQNIDAINGYRVVEVVCVKSADTLIIKADGRLTTVRLSGVKDMSKKNARKATSLLKEKIHSVKSIRMKATKKKDKKGRKYVKMHFGTDITDLSKWLNEQF